MATYQFLLYVLPKKSVKEKYGIIPKQLEINHQGWEEYWESLDINLEEYPDPDFKDAISTKWWKTISIDYTKLQEEIDSLLPRSNWSNNTWKSENKKVDHDLFIDFNQQENYIEEFQFRVDLRDSSLSFLNSMFNLCLKNEWILMDDKGNLSNPKIEELITLIQGSNADLFIRNPEEFFKNLNQK